MYKVEIIKKCGCFTKSGLNPEFECNSLEDAQKMATSFANRFNDEFCGKHKFKTSIEGSVVKVIEDEDA